MQAAVPGLMRAAIRAYRRSRFKPLRGPLLRAYRLCRTAGRGRTVVAAVDGITYELDLNETIDSAIFYEGCFEPDTTAALARLCRPGMTVLDIGANIGAHTLRCARLVGPSGAVIAFEPASHAFRRLRRNCALNGFSNITLENLALADASGRREVALACSWPLAGAEPSRRHAVHGGVGAPDVVEFVTLDAYVRQRSVPRIDLVKLDVDGYEDKVVRGAASTLRAHRPLLVMELGVYSVAEAGDRVEDLLGRLSAWGYRFYDEKTLRPFPDMDALRAAIPDRATINVVASGEVLEGAR